MNIQQEILNHLDTDYSYHLAKRLASFRTNPVLGYRTAGSKAEFEAGEMLKNEMTAIGLSNVRKDAITVDKWEFKKAVLSFDSGNNNEEYIQLGAYQTTFVTSGFEPFELIYLGKGTARDYEGRDVRGRLVLIDINQRDDWWISYPVYQAHIKGARAVIAAQSGGYGEISDEALNAQDISGPDNAPAFSISRKNADRLKTLLDGKSSIPVRLDADTHVTKNCTTYNITGAIPGRHPERIIVLSAHYDAYFDGFQDDATSVTMMLGIAKAFIESNFQPYNTILFCALAAEEWGVSDSCFDWSSGAYEQVFTAHPEWHGTVIADLNLELSAFAHGSFGIRCCREYARYLKAFCVKTAPVFRVVSPNEIWSDDFSMAIAGIPSMVNDFSGSSFISTRYHSQFDTDNCYDASVYRMHHEFFTLLTEALDRTTIAPLCFSDVMTAAAQVLADNTSLFADPEGAAADSGNTMCSLTDLPEVLRRKMQYLHQLLMKARDKADMDYDQMETYNEQYSRLLLSGNFIEAENMFLDTRIKEAELLRNFKVAQDTLIRIDWFGNVVFPHEVLLKNIRLIGDAIQLLSKNRLMCANLPLSEKPTEAAETSEKTADAANISKKPAAGTSMSGNHLYRHLMADNPDTGDFLSATLEKLAQIDNNAYAFIFDEDVYNHFSAYACNQPKERLKWGWGRRMPHIHLYSLIQSLLLKQQNGMTHFEYELEQLHKIYEDQCACLNQTLNELLQVVSETF